jgi:predicted signal transduction protein with EAL and GGDEF domain
MTLVRGIEGRGPRQAIVRAIMQACVDLGIDVIAEGVETLEEYRWFEGAGVTLVFQPRRWTDRFLERNPEPMRLKDAAIGPRR